jgi:Zn-dependent protease
MNKSWRLGSLFGFPVDVNLSFLLLLGLVFVAFGGITGVALVCLVFASVVLHELGHALVARHLNVHIAGIELSFFGGAAKMVELPRTANHELAIAAAGPAVSLMLGGVGFALGATFHSPLLLWLGWTNIILAGFNLIPALPMDGGRILRALLTRKMDYIRATDTSVKIARVVAIAFAVFGLFTGAYQLLILAPFLWLMGTREQLMARAQADRYAYGRDGYVERTARWGEPTGRWGGVGPSSMRRFTIRQRDGRMVIEEI